MNLARRKLFKVSLASGGWLLLPQQGQAQDGPAASRQDEIRRAMEALRPLMQAKVPPRPGDWLEGHKEGGQPFGQYRFSNPNRPTKDRTTLYVQPIGEFSPSQKKLIKLTAEFMEIFFGLPVKHLDGVGSEQIPESARRVHPQANVKQILTTHVLDHVLPRVAQKDAVATLALTTSDLWPGEGWNFVFGQASLTARTGVWSLARFGDPENEWPVVLRRTLSVATHETGHMLGIKHCIAYECGMNGANSLDESDRNVMPFCVECDAKLWWACNLRIRERLSALAEFCQKHELKTEAAEWGRLAAKAGSQ